jgi:hypothetical protein
MSCTLTTEGSLIVLALVRQLRALNQEVDVVELMRRVQNDVIKQCNNDVRQTSQVSIFPHSPSLFSARSVNLFIILVRCLESCNFQDGCGACSQFKCQKSRK